MSSQPLKLLTQSIVDDLAVRIAVNKERYLSSGFSNLSQQIGWEIESTIGKWDPVIAGQLDASNTPEAEIKNSLLVYRGMSGMTPALAREERLWARLCHIECWDFARKRWLRDNENLERDVKLHFFAPNLPGCRDANAVGRLWWNGHLASLASPEDIELGLRRLLSRANIRLQIMDRAETAFREPLVRGIFRRLGNEEWFTAVTKRLRITCLKLTKEVEGFCLRSWMQNPSTST